MSIWRKQIVCYSSEKKGQIKSNLEFYVTASSVEFSTWAAVIAMGWDEEYQQWFNEFPCRWRCRYVKVVYIILMDSINNYYITILHNIKPKGSRQSIKRTGCVWCVVFLSLAPFSWSRPGLHSETRVITSRASLLSWQSCKSFSRQQHP